jgi:hypothetical protein
MVTCVPYLAGTGRGEGGFVCEFKGKACWLTFQANLEHLKVGSWHFFQICNIPLLSAPKRHAWHLDIFWPFAVRICVQMSGETGRVTLHAISEHLDMEYCKSEISYRSLRISRFWHFSDLHIPLLSAPKWHAKFPNIFWPGAVRICVWVPGQSMSIHFASQSGALRSGIFRIFKKLQIPEDVRILELFSCL